MAPAAKMRVLGDGSSNGVDMYRFSPGPSDIRARFNLPQEALVVGFVGRLTRDKGIPELIEAFDTILENPHYVSLAHPLHRIRSRHCAILPGHGRDGLTDLA